MTDIVTDDGPTVCFLVYGSICSTDRMDHERNPPTKRHFRPRGRRDQVRLLLLAQLPHLLTRHSTGSVRSSKPAASSPISICFRTGRRPRSARRASTSRAGRRPACRSRVRRTRTQRSCSWTTRSVRSTHTSARRYSIRFSSTVHSRTRRGCWSRMRCTSLTRRTTSTSWTRVRSSNKAPTLCVALSTSPH